MVSFEPFRSDTGRCAASTSWATLKTHCALWRHSHHKRLSSQQVWTWSIHSSIHTAFFDSAREWLRRVHCIR